MPDTLSSISVDGTAGSGTSSFTRELAKALTEITDQKWSYLNTGSIYRALAWYARMLGYNLENEGLMSSLAERAIYEFRDGCVVSICDATIREIDLDAMGEFAKVPATFEGVRAAVRKTQKQYDIQYGPCIIEGRDVGVSVLPDADVKVWMDAAIEVRAQRRSQKEGREVTTEELAQRDHDDRTRKICPMLMAPGSMEFDTTNTQVQNLIEEFLCSHQVQELLIAA